MGVGCTASSRASARPRCPASRARSNLGQTRAATASRGGGGSIRRVFARSGPAWEKEEHGEEEEAVRLREALYEAGDLWSTSVRATIPGGGAERCDKHTAGRSDASPRFRLAYMPMRNRAEVPRLVMEEAGCPYEFDVIGFQVWKHDVKANDDSLPFGKVPVLYSLDPEHRDAAGEPLAVANETAITRFLARQLGMAGKGPVQEARVDMLYVQYIQTMRNNTLTHEGELYSVGACVGWEATVMARIRGFVILI